VTGVSASGEIGEGGKPSRAHAGVGVRAAGRSPSGLRLREDAVRCGGEDDGRSEPTARRESHVRSMSNAMLSPPCAQRSRQLGPGAAQSNKFWNTHPRQMTEIGLEVLERAPVAEQRVAALERRVERQPLAVLVPQLLDRLPALVEEQQVAEQHLELLVLDRAARVELQGLVRRGQRVRAVEAGQQLRHRARHRRGVDRPRAVEPDAAVERLPLAGRRQLQPRAAAAARDAAAGRAAQRLEQLVALLRDEAHPALRPVAAPAPVALLPRARDVHHLAGLVDVHHLAVLADLGVRRHADARAAAVLARRRLGHCVCRGLQCACARPRRGS
jgi:hypothetical protein